MILADVHTLRAWLPEVDEDTWARLLIAASSNLAWAESPDSDHAAAFAREVERLGDRHQDYSEDLYQVEYVQIVKAGLGLLGGRTGAFAGIFQLLSISWDEQGPEFRARFRAYVGQIAQDPRGSLACLDQIHSVVPAVLGRLSTLLGGLDFEEYRFIGSNVFAEIAPVIERFLKATGWTDYRPSGRTCCGSASARRSRRASAPGRWPSGPNSSSPARTPWPRPSPETGPCGHVYRACENHLGRS